MLEKYINLLRPEVKNIFSKDSSGHDIGHLERTMNNALFLQKYEGGDELVIGVSAFLHDIHRVIQNEQKKYCSPKESLSTIKRLLEKVNFPIDKIDEVLHAVEFHEIYDWHSPEKQTTDINALILQDADNLDAIGAIGIARTFAYGGAHGVVMYEPDVPLNENNDYAEENGNDESTIHHFYHKLFNLGEHMNTKSAKQLAEQKTEYMKNYVDEFMKEWNGDYTLQKVK